MATKQVSTATDTAWDNVLDVLSIIRDSYADIFTSGEPLTNGTLTNISSKDLVKMMPEDLDDLTGRPVYGRHGKIRAGYLAAAAVSVLAAAIPSDATTRLIKPTLMPLLVASSDLFATQRSRRIAVKHPLDTALLVGGLACGCLGDIILMGKDSRSEDKRVRASNLNRGAAAFAVNQSAYHALLTRQGARAQKKDILLRIPAVLAGIGLASVANTKALPAAAGYGTALGYTSVLAEDHSPEAALGGNLFVASDALILGRLTMLKNKSRLDALVDGVVMATYTAAQLLLVDAITKGLVGSK
ncbi:lysoplasmalogenase [Corynebacterium anserum]|uniref:lysoplasmalogenase n=1 Tax=Corynebacterium anserum TaxID=2684406 RepID=UPI001FECC236|nr:lysoplasmalogenase [Corynebacterium anserum]